MLWLQKKENSFQEGFLRVNPCRRSKTLASSAEEKGGGKKIRNKDQQLLRGKEKRDSRE